MNVSELSVMALMVSELSVMAARTVSEFSVMARARYGWNNTLVSSAPKCFTIMAVMYVLWNKRRSILKNFVQDSWPI